MTGDAVMCLSGSSPNLGGVRPDVHGTVKAEPKFRLHCMPGLRIFKDDDSSEVSSSSSTVFLKTALYGTAGNHLNSFNRIFTSLFQGSRINKYFPLKKYQTKRIIFNL